MWPSLVTRLLDRSKTDATLQRLNFLAKHSILYKVGIHTELDDARKHIVHMFLSISFIHFQ